MILQSLNQLYDRLVADEKYEIAAPGFSRQKISFRIVLKEDGSVSGIQDARQLQSKGKGKGKFVPVEMNVPEDFGASKRTIGITPNFLWDKPEYLLGHPKNANPHKSADKHFESFRAFHLDYESQIDCPAFSVVCKFLRMHQPGIQDDQVLKDVKGGFGVFQILGEVRYVHDDPRIRDWWAQHCVNDDEIDSFEGQCLVSGKHSQIRILHPDIKGFKSSTALVSIQEKSSYESYMKSKNKNCPVSKDVSTHYSKALNALLIGSMKHRHRISIASTKAVFWTDKPTKMENCFAEYIDKGSSDISEVQDNEKRAEIKRLLEAVRSGGNFAEYGDERDTPFYILGLEQPNPGRFSVRFFHRSSVGELLKCLHKHHSDFEIDREKFAKKTKKGERPPDPEFPSIKQILNELAPPKGGGKLDYDKIPPLLGGALVRSIIEGVPYPEALLAAIIRRIVADRNINYLRAATIKAVLVRNHKLKIPIMLDVKNTKPAYRLGRLFSALEKTQQDALGDVGASIRDRFYSAASATPGSVFPRLIRTYQHHLGKLSGGLKVRREQLIQDIVDPVHEFPAQLNLEDQGFFAIGYYHQRKALFTKKGAEKGIDETSQNTESTEN